MAPTSQSSFTGASQEGKASAESHTPLTNSAILATPSDAIPESEDDNASVVSKHSLKTIAARDEGPAVSARLAASPSLTEQPRGSLSDDDPIWNNTITGRRSSKVPLTRPYNADSSDEEADWADLRPGMTRAGAGGDETVRITIHGAEGDANDAETKAMIQQERRRVLVRVASQMLLLFLICAVAVFCFLWLALPVMDEKDRGAFKIPRSFDELKALNAVLQRYKRHHRGRVFFCWLAIYIFLQAFSIPGSMYMSILAGAIWGIWLALPIVVFAIATGATMCYLVSRQMGEVLVAVPSWKIRVDSWKERISREEGLLSYLIIIRMSPVPPHFVVNLIAPHLGIGVPTFWLSTAVGVAAVSFIHVTIGQKLDEMTSPKDFRIVSWQNFLLLAGVCLAVLIPVAMRRFSNVAPLEEPAGRGEIALPGAEGDRLYVNDHDDGQQSDDELPSIGKIRAGVRTDGAELDGSGWQRASSERELDADVVQNPFDSDDEDRFTDREQQSRSSSSGRHSADVAASSASKVARTLGINNVTNKAAKVLGLGTSRR